MNLNPLRGLVAAVALLTLSMAPVAHADEAPATNSAPSKSASTPADEGWYAGLSTGVSLPSGLPNRNFAVYTPAVNFSASQGYGLGNGLSVAGQVGYQLKDFRLEGEFLYQNMTRSATNVSVTPLGLGTASSSYASANVDTYSGFINGYYDFNRDKKWSPYIGVGVGLTNIDTSQAVRSLPVTLETPGVNTTVFAYQAKLGLSYNVDPKTALFLQYRYMGTAGFNYGGARVTAGGQVYNVPGISNSLSNSSFELGGRFRF